MPTLLQLLSQVRHHWLFILYLCFGLFLRFWNVQHSLYFIYDQGRDAIVLNQMAHGHFILTGPTSGIDGFFLGPLWYFVGLPGFLLSGGNPYGICMWYIFLSFLALPLCWYFTHQLFCESGEPREPRKLQKFWAVLCAVLMACVTGSIHGSLFIWNPLLSIPLMMLCILSLRKARDSRAWLAAGFLFLALTLQSEFAYGVFFMPVLFLAIPWIRKKFDVKDFLVAGMVVGITLLPQLFFELRHQFLMTHALLGALQDHSHTRPWAIQIAKRPMELLSTSMELLLSPASRPMIFDYLVLAAFLIGVVSVFAKFSKKTFLWQLTALFAVIPYPFFMLWRGNEGAFFPYYLAAHYLFLIPMILLGLREILSVAWKFRLRKVPVLLPFAAAFAATVILVISYFSWHNWKDVVWAPDNQAGLNNIMNTVARLYEWDAQDKPSRQVVHIYTTNRYTSQYDYAVDWYARKKGLPEPRGTIDPNDKYWYLLIEDKDTSPQYYLQPWYYEATKNGVQTREEKIGNLTVETWKKK